jgi:hypothetical protein
MGYGEPTEEKRCVPSTDGCGVLNTTAICMQRTRSGRQPLDAETTAIIKARPAPPDPNRRAPEQPEPQQPEPHQSEPHSS